MLIVHPSEIFPAPTDDEAVAIAAAIEALWPKPLAVQVRARQGTSAWRFSGRWWHRDRYSSKDRPWT